MAEAISATSFVRLPGIDDVGVWTPLAPLRVHIADTPERAWGAEEDRAWDAIRAANPRAFDAEILRVDGVDFAASVIRCVRDRYRRLAVQRASATPPRAGSPDEVRILGVKGFITARDARGGEHVLIGKRGAQTRVYPGGWESAPAGGVAVPPDPVRELTERHLAASVEEEGEEELGLTLDARAARVVAVCRDEFAGSDDIFLAFELPGVIDPRRSPACHRHADAWEYADTAWLARADAPGFESRGLIAPVRAVLRVLGWTGV